MSVSNNETSKSHESYKAWTVDNSESRVSQLLTSTPKRSILKGTKSPDPYSSPVYKRIKSDHFLELAERRVSFASATRIRIFERDEVSNSPAKRTKINKPDQEPLTTLFDTDIPTANSENAYISRLTGSPLDRRKRRPDLFGSPPGKQSSERPHVVYPEYRIRRMRSLVEDMKDDNIDGDESPDDFRQYLSQASPVDKKKLFDEASMHELHKNNQAHKTGNNDVIDNNSINNNNNDDNARPDPFKQLPKEIGDSQSSSLLSSAPSLDRQPPPRMSMFSIREGTGSMIVTEEEEVMEKQRQRQQQHLTSSEGKKSMLPPPPRPSILSQISRRTTLDSINSNNSSKQIEGNKDSPLEPLSTSILWDEFSDDYFKRLSTLNRLHNIGNKTKSMQSPNKSNMSSNLGGEEDREASPIHNNSRLSSLKPSLRFDSTIYSSENSNNINSKNDSNNNNNKNNKDNNHTNDNQHNSNITTTATSNTPNYLRHHSITHNINSIRKNNNNITNNNSTDITIKNHINIDDNMSDDTNNDDTNITNNNNDNINSSNNNTNNNHSTVNKTPTPPISPFTFEISKIGIDLNDHSFTSGYDDKMMSMNEDNDVNIFEEEFPQLYHSFTDDIPLSQTISLATFLRNIGVVFSENLPTITRRTSGSVVTKPATLVEQATAAASTIPEIEIYKKMASFLEDSIKNYSEQINKLDHELTENNPQFFAEYMDGSSVARQRMEKGFHLIKQWAEEMVDHDWHQYYKSELQSLVQLLESNKKQQRLDEEYLRQSDRRLTEEYPQLIKYQTELNKIIEIAREKKNHHKKMNYDLLERRESDIKEQAMAIENSRNEWSNLTDEEMSVKNQLEKMKLRQKELRAAIEKAESTKNSHPYVSEKELLEAKEKYEESSGLCGWKLENTTKDTIQFAIDNDLSILINLNKLRNHQLDSVLIRMLEKKEHEYGSFTELIYGLHLVTDGIWDEKTIVQTIAIYWNRLKLIRQEILKLRSRFWIEVYPISDESTIKLTGRGITCKIVISNYVKKIKVSVVFDISPQQIMTYPHSINLSSLKMQLHYGDIQFDELNKLLRDKIQEHGVFNFRDNLDSVFNIDE
ncbi:Spc7 kinetochore protein-domain-containing protein [Cunninghamella echinulata]|nr:Spc7 kinetochore protein-domain-containing protein [Cunninghamella echinulata]